MAPVCIELSTKADSDSDADVDSNDSHRAVKVEDAVAGVACSKRQAY